MRIRYIDVLKAFAIVAVVLYHTGKATFGYLGVDLFLVIAGFLTTRSLSSILNDVPTPTWGGYIKFELSRVIRLLPLLLIAGFVCMILGFITMFPDDYENLSESVIATNFFGNNILGAITTGDYWNVVNDYKPLMHTWYVGVLMQFYLVYPLLFCLAKLDKNRPRVTLLTMIATLAVISLLLYFSITDSAQRFYYLSPRFFEFAAGGIVALVYRPQEDKPFGKGYVYICYTLLIALMFLNSNVIPSIIRLVAVVCLSCVLLCSQDVLENKISGNSVVAKIGAASYSIFIWHQVLLAFYRYTVNTEFTIKSYFVLLICTALLSWLSYRFVEQKVVTKLKSKQGKKVVYITTIIAFIILNTFAGYIYMNAGVVRNVPELNICCKEDVQRGEHAHYVDQAYEFDKPFTTDKRHWYVIGNSFARDFVNIILESSIADSVEVSYSLHTDYMNENERFHQADHVFLSILGLNENLVDSVEAMCLVNGVPRENFVIVGEKNFGQANGQVYIRRFKDDYYNTHVEVKDHERFINQNKKYAQLYGNRYLDLMNYVLNDNNQVRVFTPDHHFISFDCVHLSKDGAIYYAGLIDWGKYMND